MTRIFASLGLFAAIGAAGCSTVGERPASQAGTATLAYSNGLSAGTARLFADGAGVRLDIAATGLPAGTHAIHLHTTGRCEGPDFASAGGHLNPSGRRHGSRAPGGAHLGDLPNLVASTPGGGAALSTGIDGNRDRVLADIFDADGTAVVIHAGLDDYLTDPAGNSGARIACGVLVRAS